MISKQIAKEYTVIGWCKNTLLLGDHQLMSELLNTICTAINMKVLASNSVDVALELEKLQQDQFEDEGGSTVGHLAVAMPSVEAAAQASLILSTSHIHMHGWPDRDASKEDGGFFWLAIGSCRSFDPSVVDRILDRVLHVTVANKLDRDVYSDEQGKLTSYSRSPLVQ
jgi:S-adenosylmethionine/arginine decarboxylase-like enzyme